MKLGHELVKDARKRVAYFYDLDIMRDVVTFMTFNDVFILHEHKKDGFYTLRKPNTKEHLKAYIDYVKRHKLAWDKDETWRLFLDKIKVINYDE